MRRFWDLRPCRSRTADVSGSVCSATSWPGVVWHCFLAWIRAAFGTGDGSRCRSVRSIATRSLARRQRNRTCSLFHCGGGFYSRSSTVSSHLPTWPDCRMPQRQSSLCTRRTAQTGAGGRDLLRHFGHRSYPARRCPVARCFSS